jgi:flagellar protein FliT
MKTSPLLSVYEEMAVLTGRMLACASNGDWDQLVELESQCAARVRVLQAAPPAEPLSGPVRERKVQILRELLDNDRAIRQLTTPWMAELAALINSTGAERRLAHTYGA